MKKTIKWKLAQFFEIRWWKKYQTDKAEDYLNDKRKYWQNLLNKLEEHCQLQPNQKILDVGCGPSGFYMVVPNPMEALDPLIQEYENNITFFSQSKYPNVRFHSIPFETFNTENKYNVIVCMNAVNHFSQLDFSLKKLENLLTQNGFLMMGIDVHRFFFLKMIFKIFPFDILHPHQNTNKDYIKKLKELGFKIRLNETLKKGLIFNYNLFLAEKV